MNDHDQTAEEGDEIVCQCGRRFPSHDRYLTHWQLERARAALRGDKEDAG